MTRRGMTVPALRELLCASRGTLLGLTPRSASRLDLLLQATRTRVELRYAKSGQLVAKSLVVALARIAVNQLKGSTRNIYVPTILPDC